MRAPRQWLDPLKFYRPTSDFSVFGLWRVARVADCNSCSTSLWLLLYFGRWICIKTSLQPHTGLKHDRGVPLIGIPNPGWEKKVLEKGLIWVGKILCVLSATFFHRHILCFGNKPLLLLSTLKKKMRVLLSFQETYFTFSCKLRGMMCQRATGRCQNCDCVLVHAAVFWLQRSTCHQTGIQTADAHFSDPYRCFAPAELQLPLSCRLFILSSSEPGNLATFPAKWRDELGLWCWIWGVYL